MGLKSIIKGILGPAVISVTKQKIGQATHHFRSVTSSPLNIQDKHLHLGCGDRRLKGFINVDSLQTVATDIVSDISKLHEFEAGSVTSIYACHVCEHFAHDEIPPLFNRWFELLKPGGHLRISVPDIDRVVKIYIQNWDHFQTPGNAPWIGLIYGGQKDQYDFHKTGFNFTWMKHLLTQAGFVEIQEYPHLPHFAGEDVVDLSIARAPFEDFFSLNVIATKPSF